MPRLQTRSTQLAVTAESKQIWLTMYVANRAFGGQGTITKIAGFREDCVDRNGDGVIQTSEDVNLNGLIDRHIPGEYWGQEDECLLWTVDVGQASGGIPRAIAVAGSTQPSPSHGSTSTTTQRPCRW